MLLMFSINNLKPTQFFNNLKLPAVTHLFGNAFSMFCLGGEKKKHAHVSVFMKPVYKKLCSASSIIISRNLLKLLKYPPYRKDASDI